MKVINFIKEQLKPYLNKEITIFIVDTVWDKQIKDWVDKEVKHTGIYKGIMSQKRYEYDIDVEFDELKIKFVNKEGKGKFYKIDMNTNFEFPKL